MRKRLFTCFLFLFLFLFLFEFTNTNKQTIYLDVKASSVQKDAKGNPINWCRGGFFLDDIENLSLASVSGSQNEKAYFFGDDGDCPKADDPKCQKKSYLISSDKVFISKTYQTWSCSWYTSKKGGGTVGWLQTDKLKTEQIDKKPALEKWVGNWSYYDNSIQIKKDGKGALTVEGTAIYKAYQSPHTGEIEAVTVKPEGNKLTIGEGDDEYSCKVTLILAGDFLVVDDNSNCGGANVRFDGIYIKRASQKR